MDHLNQITHSSTNNEPEVTQVGTTMRPKIGLFILLAFALSVWGHSSGSVTAQSDVNVCDEVRFLMQTNSTPYEFGIGGGVLSLQQPANGSLDAQDYIDLWSFDLALPRDDAGRALPVNLTVQVSSSNQADLEFTIFRGMHDLSPYQTTNSTITVEAAVTNKQEVDDRSTYTVAVRRTRMLENLPTATYTVNLTTSGGAVSPPQAGIIRNGQVNQPYSNTSYDNIRETITLPSGRVQTHTGTVRFVNPRTSTASEVLFPNENLSNESAHSLTIGDWAQDWYLLGGDLALSGIERTYFLKDYNFRGRIGNAANAALLNFESIDYPDGTFVKVDWNLISGIWVTNECVGYKLPDGRTFTAPIIEEDRSVIVSGTLDAFAVQLNTLDPAAELVQHNLVLSYNSIASESETTLAQSVLTISLLEERTLIVQSTDLSMTTAPPIDGRLQRLDMTLLDQDVTLTLDWINLGVFSLRDNIITLTYLDEPRTQTTRDGTNLSRLEALEDVIHITYKPTETGDAGEQRLLLPRSESYLEIVTPAGLPAADARVMPDEVGYIPRALNNLGTQCYPASTVVPIANCAPNGDINPANGNLTYGITDHLAYGGDLLNLDFTRYYNSRAAHLDSPLGFGWTLPYLLDYNIPYSTETNSRPIPTVDLTYPVALDVRYVPRGIAFFTTPSGSRHQFQRLTSAELNEAGLTSEAFRALTMPGWILSRESLRDTTWVLTEDDGLTWTFDRAGRLLSYGYPAAGRIIQIDYPYDTLNGSGSLGNDNAIIITDAPEGSSPTRQLELFYNTEHRIERTQLRDLTQSQTGDVCVAVSDCFGVEYRYTEGQLTEVVYHDTYRATYNYDSNNRLQEHNDAFAPIASRMVYTYGERGHVETATVLSDEVDEAGVPITTLWRQLSFFSEGNNELVMTFTDEAGATVNYTYNYIEGDLRSVAANGGTGFALLATSSPLEDPNDTDTYEDVQSTYTWENGFLTDFNVRQDRGGGRNTIDFDYTPEGYIACVACVLDALPEVDIDYDGRLPTHITYENLSAETFSYAADGSGRIEQYVDPQGAIYNYTWGTTPNRLVSVQRENDSAQWDYTYNDVGQVTQVRHFYPDDTNPPYTIDYTYDGLGQVIVIEDSQLGSFDITYGVPTVNAVGQFVQSIIILDPINSVTEQAFLVSGERILEQTRDNMRIIQQTRYQYDALRRLISEEQLSNTLQENIDLGIADYLTTTYKYEVVETIEPLNAERLVSPIRGYRILITYPDNTQEQYVFDAYERLRRVIDIEGLITDYTYDTQASSKNFGVVIWQDSELGGETPLETIRYDFDTRRQLSEVVYDPLNWTFTTQGDSARVGGLQVTVGSTTSALREVSWEDYLNGAPQGVRAIQRNIWNGIPGQSIESSFVPSQDVLYDFANRPITVVDGEDRTYQVAYCPTNDLIEEVYDRSGNADCTGNGEWRVAVDHHQRLQHVVDEDGVREFVYVAEPETNRWRVEGKFSHPDETVFTQVTWYDAVGNMVEFRDEIGQTYHYEYDTLQQLIRRIVSEFPEETRSYVYDRGGRLIEVRDDLGRGFDYNYDSVGRITSQVAKLSIDTTSYTYNNRGSLSSITSPSGEIRLFEYNDPIRPQRLTGIIEPTGDTHQFVWNDTHNTLVYTDPANRQVTYFFDGMGLLWRINDPIELNGRPRTHTILYDSAGYPVRLQAALLENARVTQNIDIAYNGPDNWTITSDPAWSQDITFNLSGQLQKLGAASFDWDLFGRLQQIEADDLQWQLTYADQSQTLGVMDGFGNLTQYTYDGLWRILTETLEDTALTYNYMPQSGSNSVVIEATYLDLGTRRYTLSPGNAKRGRGATITVDAHGQRRTYTYTTSDLLQTITTEICSDEASPELDACNGDVWRMQISFAYDSLSRLIQIIYPDDTRQIYTYDNAGNLANYQDRTGRQVVYEYDAGNRLTRLRLPTGVALLMSYNELDRLIGICRTTTDRIIDFQTCITEGGLIENYNYNVLGQLIERELPQPQGNSIIYIYDDSISPTGRNRTIQTPAGRTVYTYNSIGLLSRYNVGNQSYDFTYAGFDQVQSAGNVQYAYDLLGRVTQQAEHELTYTTDGVAIQTQGQNRVFYGIDARGILTDIEVGSAFARLIYPTEQLTLLQLHNELEVTYGYNTLGELTELGYFSLDYDLLLTQDEFTDQYLTRQNVESLSLDSQYNVVYGYDSNNRPLAVRFTDINTREVLYTVAYRYDETGQLIETNNRYQDGSQLNTILTYGAQNQVIQSQLTISIVPVINLTWLGLLSMLGMFAHSRRRTITLVLTISVLGVMFMPNLAQSLPTQQGTFVYTYTPSGLLESVTLEETGTTCVRYRYDDAQRLIEISQDGQSRQYQYDAFDRLVGVNNIQIEHHGAAHKILSVQENETYYFGQAEEHPPIIAASSTPHWIFSDGHHQVFQVQDGTTTAPLWIFDAYRNHVNLELPTDPASLCIYLFQPVEEVVGSSILSPYDGVIWDTTAGLYFINNRVYDMRVNQFLQPRKSGADSAGNLYANIEESAIPQAQQAPVYELGLALLQEAQQQLEINTQLSAAFVLNQALPQHLEDYALHTQYNQYHAPFSTQLDRLYQMPRWLSQNYNLAGAEVNRLTGAMQLPTIDMPAQMGTSNYTPVQTNWENWQSLRQTSIQSTNRLLPALIDQSRPPTQLLFTPTSRITSFNISVGHLGTGHKLPQHHQRPETVLEWLPTPLHDNGHASSALSIARTFRTMPLVPIYQTIENTFRQALPEPPPHVPAHIEEWQSNWVSDDTFGIEQYLMPRRPSAPTLPMGTIRFNVEWLLGRPHQ